MKRIASYLFLLFVCLLGLKAGIQHSACNFSTVDAVQQYDSDSQDKLAASEDVISDLSDLLRLSSLSLPQSPTVNTGARSENHSLKLKHDDSYNNIICDYCSSSSRTRRYCSLHGHVPAMHKMPVDYYVFALRQILI